MIIFYKPQYLLLLLIIPLSIFVHLASLRTTKRKAIKFANFEAIRKITGVELFSKNLTVLYLNMAIMLLLVLSISGMSMTREAEASKLSFVIAIDNSRSMAANDISPTRFEAARKAADDFLGMIPEKTRVGVISFSTNAIIEAEVTDDRNIIKNALRNLRLGSGAGGTDAINALITSSNLLAAEEARAIIFISDGGVNINSIQDVIDYTSKNKIIVHCLGVGTLEGGEDETGAIYKISEDLLKIIAENTGGRYYNIKNVDDFYYSLASLIEVTKKKTILDLSPYLLAIALILVFIDFYLINNRFRIFP
jgi:Ca-activated chloride channel family protein